MQCRCKEEALQEIAELVKNHLGKPSSNLWRISVLLLCSAALLIGVFLGWLLGQCMSRRGIRDGLGITAKVRRRRGGYLE